MCSRYNMCVLVLQDGQGPRTEGLVSWLVSCLSNQFLKGGKGSGGCHDVCKSKSLKTYLFKISARVSAHAPQFLSSPSPYFL